MNKPLACKANKHVKIGIQDIKWVNMLKTNLGF
jgi:hypothetical protein